VNSYGYMYTLRFEDVPTGGWDAGGILLCCRTVLALVDLGTISILYRGIDSFKAVDLILHCLNLISYHHIYVSNLHMNLGLKCCIRGLLRSLRSVLPNPRSLPAGGGLTRAAFRSTVEDCLALSTLRVLQTDLSAF
jgi:hypothetical protein